MDEEQEQKLAQFCSVTGADTERAQFYLQASGWDTMIAASTYFENESHDDPQMESQSTATTQSDTATPSDPSSQQPEQSRSTGASSSRVQTFSTWSQRQADSSEEEEGQAYYAGGSEESGQQILGPSKGKKKGHVADDLFKAAKEHGAEVVSESDRGAARNKPSYFVGTGYRLGESVSEPNQPVLGARKQRQPMTVVLRLWKTGFTINDEPLRPFDDPNNREFLQSIQRGQIPQELVSLADGGEVALDMEDHRHEDYEQPKQPKMKAFSGDGQALGSVSSNQPAASTAASTVSASAVTATVDSSQPITSLQIRLSDGSRFVAKFNHGHTVGDVQNHILAMHPQYSGRNFSLMTNLPSRHLDDSSVTLKQADLLNAVIMQKLI